MRSGNVISIHYLRLLFLNCSILTLAASLRGSSDGQELLMNMRQKIVENFQERMQLRRSLIELEDQNVQNSIEVNLLFLVILN
jgi:hypothetical protein